MVYTVKRGDTLYKIAKLNGLTLQRILDLNPDIENPNLIHPGQQVLVRDASSIEVKGGGGNAGLSKEGQHVVDFFLQKGWRISSDYGIRKDPFTGSNNFHRGIDFAGKPIGEPIATPVAGKVLYSAHYNGWGNLIGIQDSSGFIHLFAHLDKTLKSVGELVKSGDIVGLNGSTGNSTGPHLHYQINTPMGGIVGANAHTDPKMFNLKRA